MSLEALEEEIRNHIEGNIYDREHNPEVSKWKVFANCKVTRFMAKLGFKVY